MDLAFSVMGWFSYFNASLSIQLTTLIISITFTDINYCIVF